MTRLDILFKKIRDSFTGQDLQTIILFVVIVVFIVFLLISPVIINLLWKRRMRKTAEKQYKDLVELFQLDSGDEMVLEKLCIFLKNPWKKYLLLTNPRTYLAALHKLYKDIDKFRSDEQALSQKILNIEYEQFQKPESTWQFRKNHQLIIIYNNRTCFARIKSSDQTSFSCELASKKYKLASGDQVLLLYPYGNGLAVGNTVIDQINEDKIKMVAVDMDPPDDIDYKDLKVDVFVKRVTAGSKMIPAELRQIHGLDFYLSIQEHKLKRQNDIKIFFAKEKGSVPVNAEVISSRKKQIIAGTGYFI